MSVFTRFLSFIIFLGIAFFFVWYGLSFYGLRRPTSEYETPLVKELKLEPRPILWEEFRTGQNSQKFIYLDAYFKGNDWQVTVDEKAQRLAVLLRPGNFRYLILNFNLDSSKALPELRAILRSNDVWKRTVLCSAADGILRDLRELEPEWTFCSGEIFMARMLGLESIRLGSLARIDADVFFIHLNNLKLNSSHLSIISEAQRQNKLVFIGPVARPLERYAADGWLVKNSR